MWEKLVDIDLRLTEALGGSDSLFVDGLALVTMERWVWIPLLLTFFYIVIRNNNMLDILLIGVALLLCLVLVEQIAEILSKPLVQQYRSSDPQFDQLLADGYYGSRFGQLSPTTAMAFATATFVSLLLRYRVTTFYALTWAMLFAWGPIYLNRHTVGDVANGLFVGVGAGFLIFGGYIALSRHWQRDALDTKLSLPIYPLSDVRLLICSLAFTYLFLPFLTVIGYLR